MEPKNEIWLHDTSISVSVKPGNYDWFEHGREGDWVSYRAVRDLLKENGWVMHDDARIREHHRSLARCHHAGSRKGLHFTSEIYPAGWRYEFYEDVVRDNPNGGRYDFHKLDNMPYLRRLAFQAIRLKICHRLAGLGFSVKARADGLSGLARILKDREESGHWRPGQDLAVGQPDYNMNDADRVRMKDGDVRYRWTWNGRLERGTVYYRLGSNWWMLHSSGELTSETCWRLFSYDPQRDARKRSFNPLVVISAALRRAVEAQNFEKAARIRDAIARMTPAHEFKVRDLVQVANPRYHGPGIVEWVDAPFWVGVRVGEKGDGNTWRYEWPTVRPADAPAPLVLQGTER